MTIIANLPDGVEVRDLVRRPDNRGAFFELFRDEWQVGCHPVQWNASSSHAGGLLVGLGDGSVRLVSSGVSQLTFNIALVPNDGIVLGDDW